MSLNIGFVGVVWYQRVLHVKWMDNTMIFCKVISTWLHKRLTNGVWYTNVILYVLTKTCRRNKRRMNWMRIKFALSWASNRRKSQNFHCCLRSAVYFASKNCRLYRTIVNHNSQKNGTLQSEYQQLPKCGDTQRLAVPHSQSTIYVVYNIHSPKMANPKLL